MLTPNYHRIPWSFCSPPDEHTDVQPHDSGKCPFGIGAIHRETAGHRDGPKRGAVQPRSGAATKVGSTDCRLEFVEMSDLLPDSWQEETQTLVVFDTQLLNPRRLGRKAAIRDISQWVECYSKMVAVLSARYPEKASELWAYQASIVRAARNFEGSLWIGYDRQYRREALARRDLNWSQPCTRLYNDAFTGRAKAIPRPMPTLSK